jgi:hypothetical protein
MMLFISLSTPISLKFQTCWSNSSSEDEHEQQDHHDQTDQKNRSNRSTDEFQHPTSPCVSDTGTGGATRSACMMNRPGRTWFPWRTFSHVSVFLRRCPARSRQWPPAGVLPVAAQAIVFLVRSTSKAGRFR